MAKSGLGLEAQTLGSQGEWLPNVSAPPSATACGEMATLDMEPIGGHESFIGLKERNFLSLRPVFYCTLAIILLNGNLYPRK